METKFGVGEWKMRNGLKAVVLGIQPGNKGQPWVGYSYDELGNTGAASWTDDGSWISGLSHHCDIISPWTSPIAPGHNPDKLTVDQVGEGWWLPEWEVLEKVSPEIKLKHFDVWFDGMGWKRSRSERCGCSSSATWRTRLSREELLKLIAPKKRLIRVEELPPVCWVGDETSSPYLVHFRDYKQQGVAYLATSCNPVGIETLNRTNVKWSSDLRTWNSFEVEDKQ